MILIPPAFWVSTALFRYFALLAPLRGTIKWRSLLVLGCTHGRLSVSRLGPEHLVVHGRSIEEYAEVSYDFLSLPTEAVQVVCGVDPRKDLRLYRIFSTSIFCSFWPRDLFYSETVMTDWMVTVQDSLKSCVSTQFNLISIKIRSNELVKNQQNPYPWTYSIINNQPSGWNCVNKFLNPPTLTV